MKRLLLAVASAAVISLAHSAPANAAARSYDCSKPGNANKAACKAGTKATSTGPAKPAAAVKTIKVATTTTKATAERHYDCTKAGNANKAECKGAAVAAAEPVPKPAAAAAKPVVKQTSVATTRHYDCTKAGNANKADCKAMVAQTASVKPAVLRPAAPAAPIRPAAAPAGSRAPKVSAAVEDHNPAGAIATCKDGTFSHAKGRSGACSRHGGVAKWM